VVVLFHGLTNSPRQFESLTERFVARGYVHGHALADWLAAESEHA
jgi:alpha-beta hydrolase superfamily lysophospholipase